MTTLELLKSHIAARAGAYPRYYEITYMNADTPRLSGAEYLTHGFKAGASDLLSLLGPAIEALETYQHLHAEKYQFGELSGITIREGDLPLLWPGNRWDIGKAAREALRTICDAVGEGK